MIKSVLTGIEKLITVKEIQRRVKQEKLTITTACSEIGISKSSYYNFKKIIDDASSVADAVTQLEDQRIIPTDKYWGGLHSFSVALLLCQLFPFLGIRSILDISNNFQSLGDRKATFHEMYMFLTRRGLANEIERMDFAKRMNCPNINCKTQLKELPSDKYSRRVLLKKEDLGDRLTKLKNNTKNGFIIDECQNKDKCESHVPFYLLQDEMKHMFAEYNVYLRKRFVKWVSSQDMEIRLKLKEQYPNLLNQ